MSGCAYVRVQNNYTPNVYTEGLPNFACVVRGKKLYDNRTGWTIWSANPALVLRDYLINGLAVPAARIDASSFDAAANVCDEYVTLDSSTTSDPTGWKNYLDEAVALGTWELGSGTTYRQRRYTFNGVVEADDTPGEVLEQIVQSCAGWLSYTGGVWRLEAGSYHCAHSDAGRDDLRGEPSFRPKPPRREAYNVVRGTFVGPTTQLRGDLKSAVVAINCCEIRTFLIRIDPFCIKIGVKLYQKVAPMSRQFPGQNGRQDHAHINTALSDRNRLASRVSFPYEMCYILTLFLQSEPKIGELCSKTLAR